MEKRPDFQEKVPKDFPSALHYLYTMVRLLLEEGPVDFPKPKDVIEEEKGAKALVARKIASYESVMQALKDELKKEDLILTMCATPDVIIKTRTLAEENEVLQEAKNETLGHIERIMLVETKRDALEAVKILHKERIKDIRKVIVEKMDVMDGMVSSMANILIIL
ncbi:hypothetical protein KI387_038204 [Taxus chinensis]|uniref:Uncharacterized protein n=1 Tax=Taxus chinensis TaxID=29808 RepID=A0AA38C8T5_TAXCH|nr:hypothetical protein KI387_038204 [Taxus chinensis]